MNDRTAKAIAYAARQATLINQYGMTWEAIEVNTANILAGCSVPADGKMNSAEEVYNSIMGRLRTQADTPDINELARAMQVDQLMGERDEALRERDKALEAMRIEATAAQDARQHMRLRLRERDDTLKLLDAARDDLKASELCRDQLRQDRDGFRKGAQFWMDSSMDRQAERDAAEAKVVKLRTFIKGMVCNPWDGITNAINTILEQTK